VTACILSSCGLRVPNSEVKAATAAAQGSGGGSGSGGGGPLSAGPAATQTSDQGGSGPAASGSTVPAAANTGGGSGGGSGSGSGSGSGGSGGGNNNVARSPSMAFTSPPGGNGGATAAGVTANSITVGNISDVGGPVPGLFAGGPKGVEAYFNYVNSQGGVYGRMLKLQAMDDQLQCSQNEANYADSIGSVFGYVGSWSLDDNCGAQVVHAHPNVPMVQTYLSQEMQALPNAFGVAPYSVDVYSGPYAYFKQKFPQDITAVGTLVGNQASAVAAWNHAQAAMQSYGYKVKYQDRFPPAQSNFTTDVIRMKAEGVKMVWLLAVNAPDAAIFASEAAEQNFKPQVWVCPVCYFGGYISESGGPSSVGGHYAYVSTADFLSDPGVPEVSAFIHWLSVTDPKFVPDEFSAYSWANAALFVHALEAAGPNLTQTAVVNALRATNVFNDGGMVTSAHIGTRTPSPCYNILQIQNGNWTKVDDPPAGFRCDGSYIP
jgi:ABC-type branched-subunit amino acid transport system substrate-binding protein